MEEAGGNRGDYGEGSFEGGTRDGEKRGRGGNREMRSKRKGGNVGGRGIYRLKDVCMLLRAEEIHPVK